MGAEASAPRPGTKLQVIGAGLPRTGTASFSEALRILLDGPVYHGGTQNTRGDASHMRDWIELLKHYPAQDDGDKDAILQICESRLDGYVAVSDSPGAQLVPELLELYPDAKVICTVREPEAWVKSIDATANASTMWFLWGVLLPLPGMRYWVSYIDHLRDLFIYLYGEKEPLTTETYHRHMAWLRRSVPKDRLVFFDVRDGWEPLCKALGKEVPKDTPFPRINDGEAIERLLGEMVKKGLTRWFGVFATISAAAAGWYFTG